MTLIKLTRAVLALFVALSAPLAAHAAEPKPLPAFSLKLTCDPTDPDATRQQIAAIQDFMAFAEDHDGQPVYIDAVIVGDAGAGGCMRDYTGKANRPGATGDAPVIEMDLCKTAARCWRKDVVQVTAIGPPLAVSTAIIMPRPQDIPENLPYRIGGYGDWLNYQGPFIIRFHGATGFDHATLTVPDAALADIWRNAACNARDGACP